VLNVLRRYARNKNATGKIARRPTALQESGHNDKEALKSASLCNAEKPREKI
jgi:hypothetical protein